jgi:hypothetical protein
LLRITLSFLHQIFRCFSCSNCSGLFLQTLAVGFLLLNKFLGLGISEFLLYFLGFTSLTLGMLGCLPFSFEGHSCLLSCLLLLLFFLLVLGFEFSSLSLLFQKFFSFLGGVTISFAFRRGQLFVFKDLKFGLECLDFQKFDLVRGNVLFKCCVCIKFFGLVFPVVTLSLQQKLATSFSLLFDLFVEDALLVILLSGRGLGF